MSWNWSVTDLLGWGSVVGTPHHCRWVDGGSIPPPNHQMAEDGDTMKAKKRKWFCWCGKLNLLHREKCKTCGRGKRQVCTCATKDNPRFDPDCPRHQEFWEWLDEAM